MLEEWAAWLSSWLKYIQYVWPEHTIAERMYILKYECKIRMQLCAILSQIHKHKEALIQANKSVKLIHHLIKDLHDLWMYYSRKHIIERQLIAELKEKLASNMIDFDTASLNELNEESLTLTEKSASKILPIIEEIMKRMIKEKIDYNYSPDIHEKPDMRNILGFLNQNEWVYNLNIGNIMQISSVSNVDLMQVPRTEYELTRESFLEKLTILSVAYFCTSTELRFIIQLKEDPSIDFERKEIESEYWHSKSLEIAWVFLPSECPLLNHILLSYQKHHSPTQYMIPEDSEYTDNLTVVKPLRGIQTWKYNPIIRVTPQPDPILSPYPLSPLRKITDSLLQRLEENEMRTIVSQSNKHTGQNSVVNLKDRIANSKKESNRSSVRMQSEKFEDAYDDSAMMDTKIKQTNNQAIQKFDTEEAKQILNDYEEARTLQPNLISNNNLDHLNQSIEQNNSACLIQNADASTNTIIVSNDIDLLQGIAENFEKTKLQKTASTNTIPILSPEKSIEKLENDKFTQIVGELEKNQQFMQELSSLISTKISEIINIKGQINIDEVDGKMDSQNVNFLKHFLSKIMVGNSIMERNPTEESESAIQISGKKSRSKEHKNKKGDEYNHPQNSFQTTQDKLNNINPVVIEKNNIKNKVKSQKAKIKSSSCNRDESSNSAGGNKHDQSKERDEKQNQKDAFQIDRHMNSFLDDWLTDDKTLYKTKGGKHKHSKYRNRPNTSLFNKKRKSLGNALASGVKGSKNFRSESAMAAHKTTTKNNYRPSSAFATHYTKSRTKSKKQPKQSQNKSNCADNSMIQNKIKTLISSDCSRSKLKNPGFKTRNTRNYPGAWNTSFEIMFSELNQIIKKKLKTKLIIRLF